VSYLSDLLKGAIDKIPEVSFDLMSRMLPGGIVVAALVSSQRLSALGITTTKPSDITDIVVFSIFAYALGLAVSALARLCNDVAWFFVLPYLKLGGVTEGMKQAFFNLGLENIDLGWNPANAMRVLDCAQDYIKSKSAKEGDLVLKLSAEVGLLYNLVVAVSFAGLLLNDWSLELLVVVSLLFLAGVIRSSRIWYRNISILQLHSRGVQPSFPITPGHEIVGEVQKIGSMVSKTAGLQEGDQAVVVGG
jgi:hypothetical protein